MKRIFTFPSFLKYMSIYTSYYLLSPQPAQVLAVQNHQLLAKEYLYFLPLMHQLKTNLAC